MYINTAVEKYLWTPVILEAGRKFSFEIRKHENPIIVCLSTISCFCWIFAVSDYFQIGLGCFLLLPKSEVQSYLSTAVINEDIPSKAVFISHLLFLRIIITNGRS